MSPSPIRFLAPVPGKFRLPPHSHPSCLGPREDEAPRHDPFPGGASPQAGTAVLRAPDGTLLPSPARTAVPAALSGTPRSVPGKAPARRRSLAILVPAASLFVVQPLAAQSMEDRARAAATSSRARTSDSDALQNNYLTPGLSGQSISTVDGKRAFRPAIACQKTASLLEIIAQPAASGDIGALRISRDTNLDGTFDQTLNLPMPVSGICANGIISCEPGTWSNCRSFGWSAAQASGLALAQVDLSELAGCYCVNNSCGSNLVWGNLSSVLKDLGGGIVGAVTTFDPRIGVAQAQIDGPVIRYIGAQTTACASNPAVSASNYHTNPAAIQGDAFAASQTSRVFQTLAGSPAATGSFVERRACTVTREVTVQGAQIDDVIARTAGGYGQSAGASGSIDFFLGSPAIHSLTSSGCSLFDYRMTLNVGDPARLIAATLVALSADDWAQVRIDGTLIASGPSAWTGTGLPPGNCERDGTTSYAPNIDLKPFLTKGAHEIWLRVAVSDLGNASAQIHAEVDSSCKASEWIVDLCAGYAAAPKCRLSNETVDGVQTVRAGTATGLTPLPQSRLFGSPGCTLQLTRDFFEQRRTYACSAVGSGLPQPDLSRAAYIIDHSTQTMLADRITSANGETTASTRAFALPDRGSVPACEPICKTRAPKVNAGVAPAGVVGAQQNDANGWDTFYHACDTASRCPLGEAEELVTGCGCLDDFPEAVVMMQTLRLGGADLVCTGAPR